MDTRIKCRCGAVEGIARDLRPATTNHVICPCKGCQMYAHYLGHADEILDGEGGSHIIQLNPAHFEINRGQDQIAVVRMTPDGPFRWHTNCCKTPLGNSFARAGVPFLGVLPMCLGHDGESQEFTALVGPVRSYVNDRRLKQFSERLRFIRMMVRFVGKMLWWRITGGRSTKPFFDPETEAPIAEPYALSDEEYEAMRQKAGL